MHLGERIVNRDVEKIHSLLILKDGKLVFEDYFYGWGKDRMHLVASVTRSVVSLLVGIAMDKGFLSGADQKVSSYFPEYISEANRPKKPLSTCLRICQEPPLNPHFIICYYFHLTG